MKKTIGIMGGMGPLATADLLIKITTMTKADCDNEHIRIYIDCDCAIPDRTGAYAMILGIDAILDMGRTALNVVGDLTCTCCVAKHTKFLREDSALK